MATVAGDAVGALLAAAEIDGIGFFSLEFLGRKVATFVAAITEWLGCTFATGAEPVALAGLNVDSVRAFLSNDRFGFGHEIFL